MLSVHQARAPTSIATFLIALIFVVSSHLHASAEEPRSVCDEFGLAVLSSPVSPWAGAPLRVIVASEKPLAGELTLTGPGGEVSAKSSDFQGGPPYFWFAEVTSPKPGA